jgi:hypothetical protein
MKSSGTINLVVWVLLGLYLVAAGFLVVGGVVLFFAGLLGPRM